MARWTAAAALVLMAIGAGACGSNGSNQGGGAGSGATGGSAAGGADGGGGTAGSGGSASGGTAGTATGGSAGADAGGAAGGDAGVASAGTLVPLYTDPSDPSWSAIVSAKQAHPTVPVIAVVNPSSGPGTAKDPSYAGGTAQLAAAGIMVLGYVATGYATRDPDTQVKPEIDDYVAWYPAVSGIFFDEQSNTAGDEPYYAALDAYAKGKGLVFTVGNPGTDTAESYVGALDMMLIYESAGLPGMSSLGGWHDNYDKHNFGIIPYAVPTLDAAYIQQAKQHVGFIYVTNDDLPNPWDSLPPYFDALLAALAN